MTGRRKIVLTEEFECLTFQLRDDTPFVMDVTLTLDGFRVHDQYSHISSIELSWSELRRMMALRELASLGKEAK